MNTYLHTGRGTKIRIGETHSSSKRMPKGKKAGHEVQLRHTARQSRSRDVYSFC